MKSETIAPRDEILQRALALDPTDRAYLADELEKSLPPTAFANDEIATVWSGEIDRRIAAYDLGGATSVSIEGTLEHVRQALVDRRSRQAES